MFYIANRKGFVTDDGDCDANIRWAHPFASFYEADAYAKSHSKEVGSYYTILTSTMPEAK